MKSSYTRKELIKEVKNRTKIGKAYAEMQIDFINWLKKEAIRSEEK